MSQALHNMLCQTWRGGACTCDGKIRTLPGREEPEEYPDHDDESEDERPWDDWCRANGWDDFKDCPQCGGNGKYDDCTPCSYCDGEGMIDR